MTISKKLGIGLAACFLAGAAIGAIGGWYLGLHFMLNQWVQEQAGDVKGHLAALRTLRAANPAGAIEFLESRLDDDLVVLDPGSYRLSPAVRTDMYTAIRAAKQYRTEHPRQSSRSGVDQMVRDVLSRELPPE